MKVLTKGFCRMPKKEGSFFVKQKLTRKKRITQFSKPSADSKVKIKEEILCEEREYQF